LTIFLRAAFWTTLLTIFCGGFLDDFVDNFFTALFIYSTMHSKVCCPSPRYMK
jgi:hypothetical protein